jgi:hypothetical protein
MIGATSNILVIKAVLIWVKNISGKLVKMSLSPSGIFAFRGETNNWNNLSENIYEMAKPIPTAMAQEISLFRNSSRWLKKGCF